MYASPNTSTLALIEAHIYNLEFAFMVVGSSNNLLAELGNAYLLKMELLKRRNYDKFGITTEPSRINYPSKLNQETDSQKAGYKPGTDSLYKEVS